MGKKMYLCFYIPLVITIRSYRDFCRPFVVAIFIKLEVIIILVKLTFNK